MELVFAGEQVGMTPDADAGLASEEIDVPESDESAGVISPLVGLGEDTPSVAVSEHHDGVVAAYGS